jgi:hypothetical protein
MERCGQSDEPDTGRGRVHPAPGKRTHEGGPLPRESAGSRRIPLVPGGFRWFCAAARQPSPDREVQPTAQKSLPAWAAWQARPRGSTFGIAHGPAPGARDAGTPGPRNREGAAAFASCERNGAAGS